MITYTDNIKLKGTPGRGLAGTTIGFFFGFAAVSLFGPTAIRFHDAMNLSPVLMGILVAIPSLSGSLLRIPFGAWVDITGGRKPFLVLLVLSLIGLGGVTLLLNLAYPDRMKGLYGLVLFFGMLSGCGIATFSVGVGQTSYWFPRRKQGFALGTYAGLGNLAPGIFSLIIPIYLQHYGFISAYVAWFFFLLAGTIAYALTGINTYYFQYLKSGRTIEQSRELAMQHGQELFPSGNVRESLRNSARNSGTWKLTILYFMSFGGFIALTAWFPFYWSHLFGFSPVKAGILTAVFSLLASIVRVAGGAFADRIGGEKSALIAMIAIIAASIAFTFAFKAGIAVCAAILLAAGMGVNNAAVFKLVPKYVPLYIGGAAGWIGGLGAFGGFVIPPMLGAIAGRFGQNGYAAGFVIFIFLALVSLVIIRNLLRKSESN
jgi:NNP family nitrate/nitrite transporter-like MFS transporter